MHETTNPFITHLAAVIGDGMEFAQVLLQRVGNGFELRHVQDADAPPSVLRAVPSEELRQLSQHTEDGKFRPLKSAPDLRGGWVCHIPDEAGLARALEELYPGAVADWHAVESGKARATSLRDFTGRQTGMYRIAQTLTDDRAMEVVRAGCDARFCLKRRLWDAPGLAADTGTSKSCIPCLEPCAIMLEFARVGGRMDRDEALLLRLAPAEVTSLLAALNGALVAGAAEGRLADFSAPLNPRRLLLLQQKLSAMLPAREDAQGHG